MEFFFQSDAAGFIERCRWF